MKIVILETQQADIPAIQAVAAASWHATYDHIYAQDYIDRFLADAYGADALGQSITSDHAHFLIARLDEQIVGFCQVGAGGNRADRDQVLYRLYIAPTHWRQGIGGALLAAAEEWLKQRGANSYHCFVHSQNEVGKAFYLKAGFVHHPAHDRNEEWYMWKELRT